jgi:RIO kinase 1
MDIKNVGDFFRRKGVDTLSDRAIFNFITSLTEPVEEPGLAETVEKLYETRESAADEDEEAALEVDNEVFRNQYIPQTLEQVYNMEKDAQKLSQGEGGDLVYKNLLADQVVQPKEGDDAEDDSEDESGSGVSLSDSESGDESRFEKGTPRGRKFEDKDEKKVRCCVSPPYKWLLTCPSNINKLSKRPSARSERTKCQSI